MGTAGQPNQTRSDAEAARNESAGAVVLRFTASVAPRPASWLFFAVLPVSVVVLLLLGVLNSVPTQAAYRLAALAVVGPLIGLYVGAVRRRALALTDTGLHYFNGIRERTAAAPGAALKIIEVRIGYRGQVRDWPVWLLIGRSGECLFSTASNVWPADKLEQLRVALNVPIERRSSRLTPRQLRREIPGSVPWAQAHVFTVTVLLIVAVSMAITILR
jgi:hypothetical protein